MITVDPAAAAWIRDAVLPRRDIAEDTYDALIRHCACMWGMCGHCSSGKHARCARRSADLRGWKPVSAETYVTNPRGSALAKVWRAAGPACRWRCPCPTCIRLDALPANSFERVPPPRRAPTDQLALF
jgi:hypothetical protein